MSIALFATPGVLAPLQGLWRWFTSNTARSGAAASGVDRSISEFAINSIASNAYNLRAISQSTSKVAACRPLRIIRILEADQAPTQVGRMVISGRMADVCAELDRLAAREAALH